MHLGYVASDRLKAIAYAAADVFVLPARDETLPLVLLESMASGTPMVASDVGGVSDVVRSGVTGYLARPGDPGDLACGIGRLLEQTTLRAWMRDRCRAIAVSEYSLELQVRRYASLYRTVVKDFRAA
jgi:glycosyltransferase involved in cell wall biosynthesis